MMKKHYPLVVLSILGGFFGMQKGLALSEEKWFEEPRILLNPFYSDSMSGDYITSGTGLRTTGQGTITISGIPAGDSIVQAYLYWNVLTLGPADSLNARGFLNGASIQGTVIGSGGDPCLTSPCGGTLNTNTSFVSDVTSLVSGNGDYVLSSFEDSGDPCLSPSVLGSSLVIIYFHPGMIYREIISIYHGSGLINQCDVPVTYTCLGFTVPDDPQFCVAYIVGDGSSDEDETTFNGSVIGTNSLNGGDGTSWDTDNYEVHPLVSPGDTSFTTSITAKNPTCDCLVWVATVFSMWHFKPGVEEGSNSILPLDQFRLLQNTPNPFSTSTLIRYQIPEGVGARSRLGGMPVRLAIYDITGRLVETLVDEPKEPGVYQLQIANSQLPGSGIYFYRLTSGDYVAINKLTHLR